MILKINGKEEKVERVSNLSQLVEAKGLRPERIVIEHNLKIVPREKWDEVEPSENDSLEIVSFVGGG